MQCEKPERGGPIGPLDWLRKLPFGAAASSDGLKWAGLEATRFRAGAFVGNQPARHYPPPPLPPHPAAVATGPALRGVDAPRPPALRRALAAAGRQPRHGGWTGRKDTLNVYLDPALVDRVAAEAFGLDPARLTVPPLDGLDFPPLRAAMGAVDAELTSGGAGGPLAAESLANVLVVHLIRLVLAPRRPGHGRDGVLPRARLRAVVER